MHYYDDARKGHESARETLYHAHPVTLLEIRAYRETKHVLHVGSPYTAIVTERIITCSLVELVH